MKVTATHGKVKPVIPLCQYATLTSNPTVLHTTWTEV
jgi:hypothetical protein